MIGDVINATARVGSLTKYYGVLFLATHDVCKRLTRAPPRKGRHIPLELFELRHKFSPKNFDKIAKTYAEAFDIKKANFVMRNASFAHSAGSINRAASSLRDACSLPPSHPLSGTESSL